MCAFATGVTLEMGLRHWIPLDVYLRHWTPLDVCLHNLEYTWMRTLATGVTMEMGYAAGLHLVLLLDG
nr:hypothetical protein BaRGS_033487 [Batillaria attramentaria]